MSLTDKLIGAAPLAAMLSLAACGGGNAALPSQQAGGVVVGEPTSSAPATADFIAKAQAATCATQHNRLFMIDKKMVFWDRAGSCPDNAYGRTLFGATPQQVLCSLSDSIGGPQTSCNDESARAVFSTIVANLDKNDLGLGSTHLVETIVIPGH